MNAQTLLKERAEQTPFTEDHYRQLADSIPQLAWMTDADGWTFWYNKRWYDYTGSTFEDMEGWGWQKLHDPARVEEVTQRFQDALAHGSDWEDTFPLRGADGEWRWFLSRAFPIRDETGRIIRWFGTNTDITDQRDNEYRERFLGELAQATQALSNASDIIAATARMLGEYLKCSRCAYAQVEADEDHFNLIGDYTRGVRTIVGRYPFSAFGQTVLRLMRSGKAYIVNDVDNDIQVTQEDLPAYRATQIQAVICVPLLKQGKLVAAMAVHQSEPRNWTPEEIELVQLVVARCWESLERARVSQDLNASESRYKSLFDSIDQGFCVLNMIYDEAGKPVDYLFVEVNPAFETHTGLKDAKGRTMRSFAPDHPQYWFDLYGEVANTGHPQRSISSAFDDEWFEVYAFRIDDAKDKRVAVLFSNISERRKADMALRESEEFTRSILASSPDCIKVISRQGALVSMNEGGMKQMEIDDFGMCVHQQWQSLWPEEERYKVTDAMNSVMNGKPARFEGFCPTAKGTPKWWEVIVTPLLNPGGDTQEILSISRDITERKQAELALKERDRAFHDMADSINQMIWVTRPDGYHEYYNKRWYEFTGVPMGSTDGEGWNAIFHPDDQPRAWERWRHSLAAGELYEIEYRLRRADGVYRWVLGRAECVRDEQGNITKWYGTCTDIQDVIEARQAAEAANIAKSEFLANMSHEIRTPMNAVIGLANILVKSAPLTQRQQEYLKTLQLSADALLALINDLLDIAKIESHAIELECISFSINQSMEEIISIMSVRAQEKQLDFHFDGECVSHREFLGDPTRLRQILMNLCSNAIKFTEKGSVHVSITCEPGSNGEEWVSFAVKDTGIGIAPAQMQTIFHKFVQADSTINRKYGGTGLGLAITKTLVEIMGGNISVESAPGQGSTFLVRLPFKPSENTKSESGVKSVEHSTPTSSAVILLVEDYVPNVMVATTFLEQFGYRVDVAHNGVEALTKVKLQHYALILMDVQMHGMNGFEATERIRLHEKTTGRHTPIIGMTAHALSGDRERCLAAGMDEYIAKPFNPDILESMLSRFIAGEKISAPA